jgi:hypothetical protein
MNATTITSSISRVRVSLKVPAWMSDPLGIRGMRSQMFAMSVRIGELEDQVGYLERELKGKADESDIDDLDRRIADEVESQIDNHDFDHDMSSAIENNDTISELSEKLDEIEEQMAVVKRIQEAFKSFADPAANV